MEPVTHLSRQIVDGNNVPHLVRECFRIAVDEKPGPVHLELPEDIAAEEVDRVATWVQEATDAATELLCGGERVSDTVYAPTVLLNPPDDAKVSQEEIFGPVGVLYTYDDIDDALARANAPDLFFQAAIFTRDVDTAFSASRRLKGMAVMVNDHTAFRVDWMPFGGHRQSGLGAGGIGPSMRDMTLERMVVFKTDI
jgi:acyl-CoA reductase-like NAD-dependent aldehyde dehydrogenase